MKTELYTNEEQLGWPVENFQAKKLISVAFHVPGLLTNFVFFNSVKYQFSHVQFITDSYFFSFFMEFTCNQRGFHQTA